MKKYLLVCLFLSAFSSSAQMNPSWVNHFCCFDSIAPHTFSFPYGVVVTNDSAVIAFYEDDSLKIKIIDLISGNDISDFGYGSDFVLPAFNYGGDFKKCYGGYICSNTIYVNSFRNKISFSKLTANFSLDSIGVIDIGNDRPTKLLAVGDTSFYVATLNDSINIININTNTHTIKQFSIANDVTDLYPELFLNSANNLVVVGRANLGGTSYVVILKEIDLLNDSLLQTETIFTTAGNSHKCFKSGDSLFIASNSNTVGDVTFAAIELTSFVSSNEVFVGALDFSFVRNFAPNSNSDKYYIEANGKIIQINPDHSTGFIKELQYASFASYNESPILFDPNDNPIIFRSYVNNTITNEDLLALRIDKNTGVTIDSMLYNDIRNTPDIAITQFFDNNRKLNLLFANDYDDNVILQEESQLNLIQLNPLTNFQQEIKIDVNKVFPNPAINKLIFSELNLIGSEVKIYDAAGKILQQAKLNYDREIDISDLKAGLYFIQLTNAKNELSNAKFIKVSN